GSPLGEEAPQLRLGLEQADALRARLGEHRVHQIARLRLLVRGELEAISELEHVHRTGVTVLISRERQAEATALAHDLLELRRAGLRHLVPLGTCAAVAVLSRRGCRGRRDRDPHHDAEHHVSHARASLNTERIARSWPQTLASLELSRSA